MLLTGASHLFRVALARYKKNSIDIHLQASLHERQYNSFCIACSSRKNKRPENFF
jgi:hypothetical protein